MAAFYKVVDTESGKERSRMFEDKSTADIEAKKLNVKHKTTAFKVKKVTRSTKGWV